MHDRNHELLAADRAQRRAAYDAGIAEYHHQHPEAGAHLTRAAIDACTLCDPDGYRGLTVCDHVDHAAAAARGIEACKAQLRKEHHR